MTKNNIIVVVAALILCGVLIGALSVLLGPKTNNKNSEEVINNKNSEEVINKENEPVLPLVADQLEAYNVTMTNENNPVAEVTTNLGRFQLELFEDTMPITAGNFIKLAEEGFYDGIKFHRIIDGFMIQGGDPITKTAEVSRYGTGGPGYSISDEHIAGKYLTNIRGTISMANSGPNSGGSQFFINVADNTNLDFDKEPLTSKHPVFGHIISGMEVVDTISKVKTGDRDLPVEPVVIESVKINRP